MENKILYIVIPCYNEEEVLPVTLPMFLNKLNELIETKKLSLKSRIFLVNDGSSDSTWELIQKYSNKYDLVEGISLSRNRGHQNALLAGLMEAKNFCDITISIDCDGQDDLNAMNEMIDCYYNNSDIVYGVRSNRDSDSYFKRISAETFYKLLMKLGGEIIYNHADYRLVSTKVLSEFSNYKEVNIFLRGMFPMVGFNSTLVYYKRKERLKGESHYPLKKMISLAVDGITSLSIKPIRFITSLGIVFSILSLFLIIYALISLFMGHVVSGWTSSIIVTCLLGGMQLLSLGVIGEYVGKTYLEAKHRPRYIISEKTFDSWPKKRG